MREGGRFMASGRTPPIDTAMMQPITQPVISAIQVSSGYGRDTAVAGLFTLFSPYCYLRVRLPQRLESCRQLVLFEDLEKLVRKLLASGHALPPDANTFRRRIIDEIRAIGNLAVRQPGHEFIGWTDEDRPIDVARLRTSPEQLLVEPAGLQVIEEMRIERDAVRLTGRQVEVIVDDAAVAIDAGGRAADVANALEDQRFKEIYGEDAVAVEIR